MFKGLTYTVLNFEKKSHYLKMIMVLIAQLYDSYKSIINEYFQKLVGQTFLII